MWEAPMLIDGRQIYLPPNETKLFGVLYNSRGFILSLVEIREGMYGHRIDGGPSEAYMIRLISSLKQKLLPTKFCITNQHGRGYMLRRIDDGLRNQSDAR